MSNLKLFCVLHYAHFTDLGSKININELQELKQINGLPVNIYSENQLYKSYLSWFKLKDRLPAFIIESLTLKDIISTTKINARVLITYQFHPIGALVQIYETLSSEKQDFFLDKSNELRGILIEKGIIRTHDGFRIELGNSHYNKNFYTIVHEIEDYNEKDWHNLLSTPYQNMISGIVVRLFNWRHFSDAQINAVTDHFIEMSRPEEIICLNYSGSLVYCPNFLHDEKIRSFYETLRMIIFYPYIALTLLEILSESVSNHITEIGENISNKRYNLWEIRKIINDFNIIKTDVFIALNSVSNIHGLFNVRRYFEVYDKIYSFIRIEELINSLKEKHSNLDNLLMILHDTISTENEMTSQYKNDASQKALEYITITNFSLFIYEILQIVLVPFNISIITQFPLILFVLIFSPLFSSFFLNYYKMSELIKDLKQETKFFKISAKEVKEKTNFVFPFKFLFQQWTKRKVRKRRNE